MKSFAEILKRHGLKATIQRMSILSIVHSHGHCDVDEIYEKLLLNHPTVSLATVYKNIVTMVEEGVLSEVPIAGRKSKYELKKHDHLHLVCRSCGVVKDMELDEVMAEKGRKRSIEASFTLESMQINLYGICSECKRQTETR